MILIESQELLTDFKNGVYQIWTKYGILKGWFPRTDLQKIETAVITVDEVPKKLQFQYEKLHQNNLCLMDKVTKNVIAKQAAVCVIPTVVLVLKQKFNVLHGSINH